MATIDQNIHRAVKDGMASGHVQLKLGVIVSGSLDNDKNPHTSEFYTKKKRVNVRIIGDDGITSSTATPCFISPGVDINNPETEYSGVWDSWFGNGKTGSRQTTVVVACVGKGRGAEFSIILCVVDPAYDRVHDRAPDTTASITPAKALPPS